MGIRAVENLFSKRLLFVVGKGGVGKSTVATALGLAAAGRGKRVLLVQMEASERIGQFFPQASGLTGEPRQLCPDLFFLGVEGSAALSEYLSLVIRVRRVLRMVVESRLYRYFVAAAPGLKELMTVGKVWYEQERKKPGGGGFAWDLIVVDSPATGHSLQYLRMPEAAQETFGPGLVRREAKRVSDLLADSERTAICPVTTAEEMPVGETIEMYEQLKTMKMPLGVLFVNRLHHSTVPSAEIEGWMSGRRQTEGAEDRMIEEVLRCAREEAKWAETNSSCLRRLNKAIPLPTVKLPFLLAEEFGLEQVHAIRGVIEKQRPVARQVTVGEVGTC